MRLIIYLSNKTKIILLTIKSKIFGI